MRSDVFGGKDLLASQVELCGVTGHRVPLKGPVEVELGVGKASFLTTVYVADIEDPCILGLDFLNNHNCIFDLPKLTMEVDGMNVSLRMPRDKQTVQTFRITVKKNVRIPPKSEAIVQCYREGDLLAASAIVERGDGLDEGILVGKTLVDCSKQCVPALVANVLDKSIHLSEGTVLGICEPVDKIEQTSSEHLGKAEILPDHLHELFLKSRSLLSESEAEQLENLLIEYADVFSRDATDLGCTNLAEHTINTGDQRPIKCPPRKIPLGKRDEAHRVIAEMKEQGIIEPSKSPWSFPIVMVKKKDGTLRCCVDYRALNQATVKDSYPLPRIDDTLDALSGSTWFSTLDMKSGYHQVKMADKDKEKTAFSAGGNLMQFRVMPFGLCNAPATFERLMERVLDGLTWKASLVYLDDVIVLGKTFSEQLCHLREVFGRFREVGLKLNPKKCNLLQKRVKYLGHVVSADGIAADEDKTVTVRDWPVPKDKNQLRSYLGLCTYYRKFVKNFARIAAPLHRLTKKEERFNWTEECQQAFEELKERLVTAPVLAYPNASDLFVLDTDASSCSIGGVLSQIQQGQEHVIAYFSRSLSSPERNYCVTRRELLAIVDSMKHFHHYLYGKHFVTRTDHAALQWLRKLKEPEGQLARWIARVDQYDFEIRYRPGKTHHNADALSRRPCASACRHCGSKEDGSELLRKDAAVVRPGELKSRKGTAKRTDPLHQQPTANDVDTQRAVDAADRQGMNTLLGDSVSVEELQQAQQEDGNIGPILCHLDGGQLRPEWDQVSHLGKEAKNLWSQWDTLRLNDGVLEHRWESTDGLSSHWQVVVPKKLRPQVLHEQHNSISSGHLGAKKTLGRLRQRFYWLGMRNDVKEWCRACDVCCSKKGPQKKGNAPLQLFVTGVPMERVAVDIAGPLPVSKSGNRYICVTMDYFTKWPEAIAIPNQEAETVARALVDHFFSRFGVPGELHSDQGRNFESKVFKSCCDLLGIRKTRTTPLRPQSDGMVERFNRTLGEELAKFCSDGQDNWDEKLPLLLMAYRSAEHETTDFSPAHMMLGHELRMPVDLVIGRPPNTDPPVDSVSYVGRLKQHMEDVHEVARNRLKIAADAMKSRHDLHSRQNNFNNGDKVWLFNPRRVKGKSPKLMSDWEGPYEVMHRLSDVTYRIRKTARGKAKVVHANRLWRYHVPDFSWESTSESSFSNPSPVPSQPLPSETPNSSNRYNLRPRQTLHKPAYHGAL